jgi:hypothetical protein
MLDRRSSIKLMGAGAVALAGKLPAAAASPVRPPVPRNRQVHLDFHTSGLIEGIGAQFDKAQFQSALRIGRVNHINVFAKCHMSWSYYPTKIGKMHPHLKFDLLGAQLAACREIDVRTPVYLTVGWSARDAEEHREWAAMNAAGEPRVSNGAWTGMGKKPGGQWKMLCMASSGPYHPTVLAQVEELCTLYDLDGLWLDIYHLANEGCYCASCRARMAKEHSARN